MRLPSPELMVAELIQEAGRCVACGLCLPHCPTYRKTQSEADSPRGRIALMKGVLEHRLPLNEVFVQHIDLCLDCRACERACPSKVEYGKLVDGVRPMINALRGKESRWQTLLKGMLSTPRRLQWTGRALRFYQRSGARALLRKTGILGGAGLGRIEAELPSISCRQNWSEVYPAAITKRGEVALFLGCVSRLVDADTLGATIFVLNRLGYTVHVPQAQACCGALHWHQGDREFAEKLARQNIAAFPANVPVIGSVSGCGAFVGEYDRVLGSGGRDFAERAVDINVFLAGAGGWDEVGIEPLPARVVVHDPCSMRNVLRGENHVYALLKRIPESRIEALPGNDQCCGAAGMYHLQQPKMAEALLSDKIHAIQQSGAMNYLVTSNVGCALWMAKGLHGKGEEVEIVHPVTLLARQMGYQGTC